MELNFSLRNTDLCWYIFLQIFNLVYAISSIWLSEIIANEDQKCIQIRSCYNNPQLLHVTQAKAPFRLDARKKMDVFQTRQYPELIMFINNDSCRIRY